MSLFVEGRGIKAPFECWPMLTYVCVLVCLVEDEILLYELGGLAGDDL